MKISKILIVALFALFALSALSATTFAESGIIKHLKEGNQRYISGQMQHPHQDLKRMNEISQAQKPEAVVLACSDSRVPTEIIFDQGLGDLFVVRVAGNVLNKENLGSIEYAIEHLGVKDVVIMGHSRCGAVTAAANEHGAHGNVGRIIRELRPAVKAAKSRKCDCDVVDLAAHINVENIVKRLKSSYKVNVVGAFYDLDSGKVEFFE